MCLRAALPGLLYAAFCCSHVPAFWAILQSGLDDELADDLGLRDIKVDHEVLQLVA